MDSKALAVLDAQQKRDAFVDRLYEAVGPNVGAYIYLAQIAEELGISPDEAQSIRLVLGRSGLIKSNGAIVELTDDGIRYVEDRMLRDGPDVRPVIGALYKMPRDQWPDAIRAAVEGVEDFHERTIRGALK